MNLENIIRTFDYYEDADAWVVPPYPELEQWAKEQYAKIKASGSIKDFTPFNDEGYGIKSEGETAITIEREDDITIPNRQGELVTVKGNVTVTMKMKLVFAGREPVDVVLRFFGTGDFPLY